MTSNYNAAKLLTLNVPFPYADIKGSFRISRRGHAGAAALPGAGQTVVLSHLSYLNSPQGGHGLHQTRFWCHCPHSPDGDVRAHSRKPDAEATATTVLRILAGSTRSHPATSFSSQAGSTVAESLPLFQGTDSNLSLYAVKHPWTRLAHWQVPLAHQYQVSLGTGRCIWRSSDSVCPARPALQASSSSLEERPGPPASCCGAWASMPAAPQCPSHGQEGPGQGSPPPGAERPRGQD